ncbi:MAG: hypothetical protein IKN04_18540 [Clostridia bacterium]|nr:hypothetical protein [Clostridia bacterium]
MRTAVPFNAYYSIKERFVNALFFILYHLAVSGCPAFTDFFACYPIAGFSLFSLPLEGNRRQTAYFIENTEDLKGEKPS